MPPTSDEIIHHTDWYGWILGRDFNTLITDPPFSARTHEAATTRADGSAPEGLTPSYTAWNAHDVQRFVEHIGPRVSGWMCCMTDHVLAPCFENAYRSIGRYAFAPVMVVIRGGSVRVRADGPSSGGIYLMVARPVGGEFASWGTLPGYYVGNRSPDAQGGRGKPEWLLNAIVRDYSREGDVIADPMCGWGSTIKAAVAMRRVGVGCDIDEEAVIKARKNLAAPVQFGFDLGGDA